MQVNQTSCFELVMNQRVTISLGSVIDERFVEFLSFGFTAGTSLRLHLCAQGGPRGRERRKTAYCCATEGGKGGYKSRVHHCSSATYHRVLAAIDSVAKTFDSGIAPFSVATAGINACQLLLCQLSGIALTRNHGGSEINKCLLRAWTYGSYICRNSHSFWSVANPPRTVTPVSASAFRKAFKVEGGRRSGSDAGGENTKNWASSAAA